MVEQKMRHSHKTIFIEIEHNNFKHGKPIKINDCRMKLMTINNFQIQFLNEK